MPTPEQCTRRWLFWLRKPWPARLDKERARLAVLRVTEEARDVLGRPHDERKQQNKKKERK